MSDKYDLVVIGGGSGGLAAAQRAAEYGRRVAVIEQGRLGGTCVNVGCVPKKIMWEAAALGHATASMKDYGFDVTVGGHDWSALKKKRDAYIRRLNDIYARNLASREVEYLAAEASLVDAHVVSAGDRHLETRDIIIATGGRPVIPEVPGAELGITSDGFFELEHCPGRVAVVGSGYISVELAGMLQSLGAQVSVFIRYDSVLRSFDEMLQRCVMEGLRHDGVDIVMRSIPRLLERIDGGLYLGTDDGCRHGPFETLLWAVGRAPLTDGLELETAGVLRDDRGFIVTDTRQCTNIPNIYAIGDVTGRAALTPVAIAAGRRLSDRLYGGMAGRHLDYECIPSVVFTHPPVGTCGLTEQQAADRYGTDMKVYHSEFVPLFNSMTEHKPKSHMKLITAGPDETVVGCHLYGAGSDEMLQGFAVAMRMGATKQDLDDTVAIHPTSAEELVTLR